MYVEESMKGDLKFRMQMKPHELFGGSPERLVKGQSQHEAFEEESKTKEEKPKSPKTKKAYKAPLIKSNIFTVKEQNEEDDAGGRF